MCDSERYMALPVLTQAISNTGGFGEFGEYV